jgi:hypothetical protein
MKEGKFSLIFLFFWIRGNLTSSESVLCGCRWGNKTPVVPDSYKRCTPWLELETCCADFKPFTITLRFLGTFIDTFNHDYRTLRFWSRVSSVNWNFWLIKKIKLRFRKIIFYIKNKIEKGIKTVRHQENKKKKGRKNHIILKKR